MHRVKVYKLNSEGQWEDKGTGLISVEYMEQAHAMGLVVISEEENSKTLLVHQILRADIYQRSGESTIITWHDAEISTDVAISFQEQKGCDQIWNQIKQVQREATDRDQDHDERGRKAVDDYDQPSAERAAHMSNGNYEVDELPAELPLPERRNLEEIAKALAHVPPFSRDRVAAQLMKGNYLPALLDLFKQCEDLEDAEGLTQLYSIVRCAIMLNDSTVLEEMLREEHVMDVLGALEYDPDVKQPQKHREFLQSHVQFKEVVPITNPQVLAKIHQTYRIQYLKDVILPRSLDDATYATLSSLALFNNMEVVGALMADPAFLPQLFQRLCETDPADPQWHDLVAFLQEFCNLARHLQQQQRATLFTRLVQLKLFDVVTRIMLHSSDEVKLRAVDILVSAMQHDVLALRGFLVNQPNHTLFSLLVKELTEGQDAGLSEQVCEAIKLLMDTDTMEQPMEKNDFVDLVYDKMIDQLVGVILSDNSTSREGTRTVPASTLGLIVELLCFCVQSHGYRIRYYTLRNKLMMKVMRLLRRRERWLACAAIRFIRVCVGTKDEFFLKEILKEDCFGPIMVSFFDNGDRYNLLNSAVLDLLDFIRRENLKTLLEHLVETYGHRFEDLTYVETFKQLRLKYEQAPERAGSAGAGVSGGEGAAPGAVGDVAMAEAGAAGGLRGRFTLPVGGGRAAAQQAWRRRRDDRDLEKDEEDYFSEEVDEDADGDDFGAFAQNAHVPPHAQQHPQPQQDALQQGGPGPDAQQQQQHLSNPDLGRRGVPRDASDAAAAANAAGAAAGDGPEGAAGQRQGQVGEAPAGGPGAAGGAQGPGPSRADGGAAGQAGAQWRGLVDYDDDEEMEEGAGGHAQGQGAGRGAWGQGAARAHGQVGEPPQGHGQGVPVPADAAAAAAVPATAGSDVVPAAAPQQPNGPSHGRASVDLGRRPRSPPAQQDGEQGAGAEAAGQAGGGSIAGQHDYQRKRLKSDDGSALPVIMAGGAEADGLGQQAAAGAGGGGPEAGAGTAGT